jgi:hypothetical protein
MIRRVLRFTVIDPVSCLFYLHVKVNVAVLAGKLTLFGQLFTAGVDF